MGRGQCTFIGFKSSYFIILTFIRLPAVRHGDRKPTTNRKQLALRPDRHLHMLRLFTIILQLRKLSSPIKIRTGTHTHTMGTPSHRQPRHHNLKNRQLHHLRRRETFLMPTRRRRTFLKLSTLGICYSYPQRKRTTALRQTSRLLLRIIMFQRCQHRRLMFLLSSHTHAQSFKRNWHCWWHS